MSKVNLITCNNVHFGLGNFIRTKALASKLLDKNHQAYVSLVDKFDEVAIDEEIVVLDIPIQIQNSLSIKIKSKPKVLIGIDWYEEPIPDFNFSIFPAKTLASTQKVYQGLDYAFISEDLENLKKRKFNEEHGRILISLGSSGSKDALKLHRELSKKFGNFSTVLTSRLPKEHFLEENILYKPKDFLDIMSISEIIICNAGLLLLEASYLNKSIICLPQNVYEEKFVHNLAKKYPKVVVANTLKDVTRQIEFVKSKMSKYQYDFTFSAKGFSKVLEIVETVSND